jgi:hypothetical protein
MYRGIFSGARLNYVLVQQFGRKARAKGLARGHNAALAEGSPVLHNLLLLRPEFWAALFGALAAFLLGALGTWWAATTSKRTAANLTILTLAQMYGLLENLRHHLFVREPNRFHAITGRAPRSFELRTVFGLPERVGTIPVDQLGYLADSHDPDVMSRLLTVERAFNTMLELMRTLSRLQAELMERISHVDPTGQKPMQPSDLLAAVGPAPHHRIQPHTTCRLDRHPA